MSLAGLKQALNAGNTSAFPVGTELPDTWNGEDNPIIVGHYTTINGKRAVGLLRKWADSKYQVFNEPSAGPIYPGSTVLAYLNGEYLDKCSDALKSVITEVSVKWNNGSSLVDVSGKWHLFSGIEINRTRNPGEGELWEYWRQKFEQMSTEAYRIRTGEGKAFAGWWLRSRDIDRDTSVWGMGSSGIITSEPVNLSYTDTVYPHCYIVAES